MVAKRFNLKKSELREISNIGLKQVIQDVDDVLGEKVGKDFFFCCIFASFSLRIVSNCGFFSLIFADLFDFVAVFFLF
jgi:hypothetical protein